MKTFLGACCSMNATSSRSSLPRPEQQSVSSLCAVWRRLTWCRHTVRKTLDSHPSGPGWSWQSPPPPPAAHAHVSSPPLPPPPALLPLHLAPWASLRPDGVGAKQPESPVLERRPKTPGRLATLARRATEATWVRRGTVESEAETGEAR